MFKETLNKIRSLFKKEDKPEEKDLDSLEDILTEMQYTASEIDFSEYPDPEIIDNGADKTLLILDDMSNIKLLYNLDFKKIKDNFNKDVLKDFNIVYCLGNQAGFTAHKFILNTDTKIDYAILDITLGYGVKLISGEYIEFDGVDVFRELYIKNKDLNYIFCTAHSLNRKNPTVNSFFTKYEDIVKKNIKDNYVNKNSDRYLHIKNLLYSKE